MARCSHCLSDIRKDGEIVEEIDGKRLSFCCQSCASIYRILHNAGLEEFYRRRTGWSPGPPEETKTDPSLFYDYLKGERGHRVLELTISGIRCASCIWLIEHYLKKEQAIEDIRINYATHRARIRWDDQKLSLDRLLNLISSIGYTPRPGIYSEYQEALEREKKDLLIRFGTSCFFSMQLMLYSVALYAGYFQGIEPVYKRTFQFIAWALATPVLFYGGAPFIRNTLSSIKHRSLNMDVLILLGSGSAYLYSVLMLLKGREVYFDTASMIITLILLGRFLEVSARRKAGQALQRLIELQPTDARLITPEGKPLFLPVSSIKRGQRIEVQPGEKIPLDGIVVEGEAEVDESMLTGESRPSRKTLNSEVFAGTLNINGRLVIEVSRLLKDTVLSQIITAVEEAQSRKAPVQSLADRVVGWFVPLVFSISVLTFLFWFIKTSSIEPSLMNAVSVMVIACPCALGLATPLAVLIGSLRASTKGILIKGGDILEQAAKTEVVFIDKTGTLTEGKPSVTDIKAFINRDDLIYLSCVAEASATQLR
ncbi:MAG: heavy metal translocating P-type ATPase [Nitrospirae bacterium]|nr:MAG: heavy metal translocating P-type ATPase [Nitrospirota bacterium]